MVKTASKRQHKPEEPAQQQPATRSSTRGSTTKKLAAGSEESSEQTTGGVETSCGSIKEEPVRKRRIASLNAELLVHYCSSTPALPGAANPNGASSQSVNSGGQSTSGETSGRPRRRTESNDSKAALKPTLTATSKSKQPIQVLNRRPA